MRTIAAALLAAVLAVLHTSEGAAHAMLVRAAPSSRSTLGQPPDRVSLWFNERLEPAYSALSVWDERETQVDLRDTAVEPGDPRQLRVSLPPLPAGTYSVRYRVLSVDGHVVEGRFAFTVRGR